MDGETINQEILVKRDTCYGCAVRCKPVVRVDSAQFPVEEVYGGLSMKHWQHLAAIVAWQSACSGVYEPIVQYVRHGYHHMWGNDCLGNGMS